MTGPPQPATGEAAAPDAEAACRRAAAQIRQERSGWVVIWVGWMGRYRAWPLFRAPRDTCLTARTPDELIAQMDEAEEAVRRRRGRSRRIDSET
jgi:hypothetical protein